ncbi:unnamed protein product [Protopolystoma xenopodis]|uniref:Uncharacterized protein n=1 Tax=Protopolystoma xenopodis TaxID=117903 RepID=A0A3S5A6Q4_9PLAT|nr:unnamed protein product [Protopolystoma xenopodis]
MVDFPRGGIAGRTPSRIACRSLVFEHQIRLKLPATWFAGFRNSQSATGSSAAGAQTGLPDPLVLQLDLKERRRSVMSDAGGYLATTENFEDSHANGEQSWAGVVISNKNGSLP